MKEGTISWNQYASSPGLGRYDEKKRNLTIIQQSLLFPSIYLSNFFLLWCDTFLNPYEFNLSKRFVKKNKTKGVIADSSTVIIVCSVALFW